MKKFIIAFSLILIIVFFCNFEKIETQIFSYVYNPKACTTVSKNYIFSNKILYLTFDDGPNKKNTPLLLDYLKEKKIRATFFLIGKNIKGNEDIVKRMYDEGHSIGIHSYNHKLYTKMKNKKILEDIQICSFLISNITGCPPTLIRPPYGSLNKRVQNLINLDIVLWNVDSLDWKYRNKTRTYNRVLKTTKPNSIILMHDSFYSSIEAVKMIIEHYESEDYIFLPIK